MFRLFGEGTTAVNSKRLGMDGRRRFYAHHCQDTQKAQVNCKSLLVDVIMRHVSEV